MPTATPAALFALTALLFTVGISFTAAGHVAIGFMFTAGYVFALVIAVDRWRNRRTTAEETPLGHHQGLPSDLQR